MRLLTRHSNLSRIPYDEGAAILVDKPLEWTSFDVVNKIRFPLRKLYDRKKFKVGHNGTLDPLATGLLMIFTGKYTKLIPQEENHDKRYTGVIKLGATTASLDRETEETDKIEALSLSAAEIEQSLSTFSGEMMQEIPRYSAAKVGGKRMYKLARAKKEFKPKSKPVFFNEVNLLNIDLPYVLSLIHI